jgi:type II secretory pathway component GspD/PulD (secretin)
LRHRIQPEATSFVAILVLICGLFVLSTIGKAAADRESPSAASDAAEAESGGEPNSARDAAEDQAGAGQDDTSASEDDAAVGEDQATVGQDDTAAGQDDTAVGQDDTAAGQERGQQERTLSFNFRHAPWDEVLAWFAEEADLSFALDITPTGTFNYIDRRKFTPDEALDVLNCVLLTKGYTLVRRNKMLLIIDLEDEIDAKLVRDLLVEIEPEQLDQLGEYEIGKCRFTLQRVPPEDAEKQINQLLSPVGSIVVMPKAKQLSVTETGGTLRAIREILQSLESAEKSLHTFALKNATAQEVLMIARPLLNIAEGQNSSEDGSIRVSADPLGSRVFATGSLDKVALVEQIVEQVDSDVAAA